MLDRRQSRDATDASLIGKTIRDRYVIVGRLGEGGMGRVYLAELASARARKFAVKVLRPELTGNASFKRRFHDEAQHQAQLDHENIVEMVDYFVLNGEYFLVLDYVDGQPLSDLLDAQPGRRLPEKQALNFIIGVLNGLDEAHRKGIVHRDVKPSNVLIDTHNRARITDFGIATNATGVTLSGDGQVIGTPEYMSPEQLSGSAAIDHRSDVYSTGVMLYQMLTGTLPFNGDSFESIRAQQMSSAVPNPRTSNPKIPKRLAEIVRRAMQKSPADRFQGGPQFVRAIEMYRRRGAWKYVMVSACVLLAALAYIGQSLFVNTQVVREAVRTTAQRYNTLCRETILLQKNTNGKALAERAGESDLIEAYARNMAINQTNLAQDVRLYESNVEKLTKLNQLNQWSVRYVLREKDPDASLDSVRRILASDYSAYAARRIRPSIQSMQTHCEELGYVWHPQ